LEKALNALEQSLNIFNENF